MDDAAEDVALLAAMNNVMMQSIFLTAEHLRIYNQVLAESITDDEGQELLDECKEFVHRGEDLVRDVLDHLEEEGRHEETIRLLKAFLDHRDAFEEKAEAGEKRILDRAEDERMFF